MLSVEGDTIVSSIKPQVFGNEEKESLIQLLLRSADGSGSSKSNFSVLSIVGDEGVGKTALAKLVYNDPRVQKHFELKIWVCASESLDVKQLIKEIITESGTEEKQSILTDLDSLQLILKGKMMSRRFVLVLDDVRIIDSSEWQKLYVALNHGLQGSILFVTARSLEIANQLDTSYPIFLVGLTDDVISQASDLTKSEIIRSWRALVGGLPPSYRDLH
ncbi:disease resistance protein RGA2-like [Ananas comosus]|uniref:Disease resistance protein RGA2-like n=1 Tax=Ananas comosus TaxID=4615 RepID=A0A6P5EK64_ANACO|nr:disease resistance protein RGA2-like [Ananas comosus]